MTKNIDMLHGPLMKKIFWFALPIAGSSILQQLFSAADVAVAGRFAESGALAAVGSNSVLVSFYINLFAGLSVGVNVVVSHFLGQQKRKEVGTVIHTAVLFSLFCGLILMAAGLLFSRQLLTVIGTPADVLERAILYFRIYCLGVLFISLYNFCAVILRSTGDTRRPLYCLAISVVLNIILNLLLVIGFHLGVAGVAIATSLANMAGSVMILWILSREKEDIRLELKKLGIHMPAQARMLRIGVPAALQSIVFSLSNICLQTAVNGFGSSAVAGMTAATFRILYCNSFRTGRGHLCGAELRCRTAVSVSGRHVRDHRFFPSRNGTFPDVRPAGGAGHSGIPGVLGVPDLSNMGYFFISYDGISGVLGTDRNHDDHLLFLCYSKNRPALLCNGLKK